MKITKILSVIAASAVAASALAAGTFAYTLDKDLKTGWSISTTIPAEEFEGATTDSVFTITVTVDASLADKSGENYWCIKPMINDAGWPFLDTLVGGNLSDGKDSYVLTTDDTEFKFTIPAEELEHLQAAGMAIMGHGITLGEFSWSNDETLDTAAADVAAATETTTAAASNGNPATGIEDIAGGTLLMLVAGGVMALTGKRK